MTKMIVLLVILAVEPALGSCPEYVFKMIPYKDRLSGGHLKRYLELSVKECAEKCSESSNCGSFSYKPETSNSSECYLYNIRVWAGRPDIQYHGLVTYWRLADSCPLGYIYNRTYSVCYKMYPAVTPDWNTAMAMCVEDGGYLFMANTMDKIQMLDNYFKSLPPPFITKDHYLGGSDLQNEGIWEWLDGSRTFPWPVSGAEPNGFTNENCAGVKFKATSSPAFNDVRCGVIKPFFCEIPRV